MASLLLHPSSMSCDVENRRATGWNQDLDAGWSFCMVGSYIAEVTVLTCWEVRFIHLEEKIFDASLPDRGHSEGTALAEIVADFWDKTDRPPRSKCPLAMTW